MPTKRWDQEQSAEVSPSLLADLMTNCFCLYVGRILQFFDRTAKKKVAESDNYVAISTYLCSLLLNSIIIDLSGLDATSTGEK